MIDSLFVRAATEKEQNRVEGNNRFDSLIILGFASSRARL